MNSIFSIEIYDTTVVTMLCLAVVVFLCLQFVTAGYGVMYTKKWGPAIPNRIGWVLMEAPVFIAMGVLWIMSARRTEIAPAVMATLFMLHYFQRSFIFPFLIKGKSVMPLTIIAMGVTFNLVNAYLIGGWLFYLAPEGMYTPDWLLSWKMIVGTIIFFIGMRVNIQSDGIVRNLRRPGDTGHYIPRGGMFRYVTSANYFGELLEWIGFAILTWSMAGVVFVVWTFANLAPRARKLHKRYIKEFGDEYVALHRKYILPFIY